MIYVQLQHTYDFLCQLDLPDDATPEQIKAEVERLQNDDFEETGSCQSVTILQNNKDVTGHVQPYTPKLNPLH